MRIVEGSLPSYNMAQVLYLASEYTLKYADKKAKKMAKIIQRAVESLPAVAHAP